MINVDRLKNYFPIKEDQVYLLLAIARRKNNPNIADNRHDSKNCYCFTEIVRKEEDWERKLLRLKVLVENYNDEIVKPEDFNIYVTFNPRSVKKAYYLLKKLFAEWDYNPESSDIKRVDSHWLALLQSHEARSEKKYFVIDVDVKDANLVGRISDLLPITVFQGLFETRHGWHILAYPFDLNTFQKGLGDVPRSVVEVKTDELLNIG